ncbi:hypothetical protein ACT691_16640 [Vibrio metschnikovii]
MPVKGSVIKALIEKTVSETLPPTAHAGKSRMAVTCVMCLMKPFNTKQDSQFN